MSYVKYREDDIKIIEHRLVLRGNLDNDIHGYKPVQYYDCKYCGMVFTKRENLYNHIRSEHNIVRPLVIINGKVAGDQCVIHRLESAYIDLFGFDNPIRIDDALVSNYDGDEIDITSILRQELKKTSCCRISVNDSSFVEVRLAAVSVESIAAISAVIEQWERDVSDGKQLSDYSTVQFQEGDRIFLDGMYNYYIACRAKKDKAKRYDEALSILSCFNDLYGIGKCVLKIICFRRNWVSRLRMLTNEEADDFSIAADYFERKPSTAEKAMSGKQIYIEEYTKASLDLILLFQQRKYDCVRQKLREFPDIEDLNDLNLADQLNLLSARLAVLEKNDRRAERYYEKVVTPAFQNEYRMYQKGELRFEM